MSFSFGDAMDDASFVYLKYDRAGWGFGFGVIVMGRHLFNIYLGYSLIMHTARCGVGLLSRYLYYRDGICFKKG